jgi:hypothetical protein
VDRHPRSVDATVRIPRGYARTAPDLWEPGDTTGTANVALTCDNESRSTIHSPYYNY